MNKRLSNFETLEKELENKIFEKEINEKNEIYKIVKNVPNNHQKRINQCLALINKIKILINENNNLKNINENLFTENQFLKDKILILENIKENIKNNNKQFLIKK